MAAVSGVRSCHATLGAGVADTVTLTAAPISSFDVVNHGNVANGVLYVRLDGTTPVAAADENFVILPGERKAFRTGAPRTVAVGIISASAVTYSVEATG